MSAPTRLTFPVYDKDGALEPYALAAEPRREWCPMRRMTVTRDGAHGAMNDPNFAGPDARAKFLSYALPRDGMRISQNAGLKNLSASRLPGFS